MYVFVDIKRCIKCDVEHLVATVRHNFEPSARLAVAGTIQFASSTQMMTGIPMAPEAPNGHPPAAAHLTAEVRGVLLRLNEWHPLGSGAGPSALRVCDRVTVCVCVCVCV